MLFIIYNNSPLAQLFRTFTPIIKFAKIREFFPKRKIR